MTKDKVLNPAQAGQRAKSLDSQIKARLKKEGDAKGMHPSALRKHFAFDMLLRRLSGNSQGKFVLKGGYLMELRVEARRSTKDIDFLMRTKRVYSDFDAMADHMLRELQEGSAAAGGGDDGLFTFSFGAPSKEIDGGGGGARFPVKLLLNGRVFEEFHVDCALEDIGLNNISTVSKTPEIPPMEGLTYETEALTPEQHWAEKIHALTRPRATGNTRVKDLVDLHLLTRMGLDEDLSAAMLRAVFDYWKTHEIPAELPEPPLEWTGQFLGMAAEMGFSEDLTVMTIWRGVDEHYQAVAHRI